MKNKMELIKDKIEAAREKLNAALSEHKSTDQYYGLSLTLDELIGEYSDLYMEEKMREEKQAGTQISAE